MRRRSSRLLRPTAWKWLDLAVERGYSPIKFTAALPAPHGTLYEDAAPTFESPGLERVAATAMHGDDFNAGFTALRSWVEQAVRTTRR